MSKGIHDARGATTTTPAVLLLACSLFFVGCADKSDTGHATGREADADRLIEAALADSSMFERLAYVTDTYGPRLSGSKALEDAIDWILAEMAADGLENVAGEPVMVPHWVRGDESLALVEPRSATLQILGLGGSVGTPPEGIEADVLVVDSFEELESRASEAVDKIVLFNAAFTSYGRTVAYRRDGAVAASRHGAVASLVRTVGSASMYTPHTGSMQYEEGVVRIPSAAVTIEDALMMRRMQDRGQRVRVRLRMEAATLPDVQSRNIVGELRGSEFPDEVIVMGGHIDSWDVGTGAMDDAGGCLAAWQALLVMKRLDMTPRRTIRVVCWTNEENGLRGGTGYAEAHREEVENIVLAIESDAGVFAPVGFGFGGTDEAYAMVEPIGRLLEGIGAGEIRQGGGGADIGPLMALGVPGMGLNVDGTRYFHYHHSNADTIDKLDADEFNRCVAALAVMSWAVAQMDEPLPRATPAQ